MRAARDTTVLVAGATGYLGGYVCRALHEAGYRVKALVRDEARLGAARDAVDEVFVGHAIRDSTLQGLYDGVDVAFSSIGIHGEIRRKPTVWDVDFGANMNLLRRAKDAGVRHFLFISVINGERMRRTIPVVEARERVGDALRASGMTWTLLRPTGFYNDIELFFRSVQRKGRLWLIGDGSARTNVIHGADLADIVVEAVRDPSWHDRARAVGGPEVLSVREIVELMFDVLGKPPRVRTLPPRLAGVGAALVRPFHPSLSGFLKFFAYEMTHDGVGEVHGSRTLRPFLESLVARPRP